ncbi:alpha-L-rhamnosidase [Cryptococcus wingfieldii CBS 7118]|uniref:alpha-L-rhamnosidase n=1 Tax=Cryptococcus wingfieldii CBS 7118 TaxID=1295528 RepID=A0A1E3HLS0_9TREE|nr:alpha-L-rhamnosidase [Cryptococcus wingfieldii CBS 7118]ODN77292.1 alpha-L-rhamnosidase [Cryptococcus wingfieldii CBS 7118]
MSPVTITAVQAEHHPDGFAISHPAPRLSWRFASSTFKGWKQASYRLTITHQGAKEQVYQVNSAENVLVPWPSRKLLSRGRARVQVQAFGQDGEGTNTIDLSFEAGLLLRSDWSAEFISGPPQDPELPKIPFRLVKTFSLPSLDPSSPARLYATALGLYSCTINGTPVGDHVLAPGWTEYNDHLRHQTYDITSLLHPGENTIEAYIGEGWYAGRLGRPGKRNNWGERLGWMGQIEVGGQVVLRSEKEGWKCLDGPVKRGEIYNGETFDSSYDYSHPVSSPIEILPFPTASLLSPDAPPVRRVQEINPIEIITTPSGKHVLDFGQNLVGWLRIERDFEGEGQVVLKHAEVLEDGELGMRPLRTAECEDRIILGGKTKGWEPKFTFHGFRYVQVEGINPTLKDFTAIVIFSDMRRTGYFKSDHKAINQLHENVVWGMKGNFVSVPTDCFLSDWLLDLYASQKTHSGVPPTVIPYVPPNKFNSQLPKPQAAWADVVALLPWDLYESTGNVEVLEQGWEGMRAWLDEGVPRGEDGMWSGDAELYGDWLDPNAPPQYPAHGRTDTHLVANAYLIHVTRLLAHISTLLSKPPSIISKYTSDAKRLHALFLHAYVSPKGRLVSDTQTAYALALKFDLLPDEAQKKTARERLAFLVRWNSFKVSTGFAGTPILLSVLADGGMEDLAYRMLQEKDCPGWLYAVGMGATTIWERWDSMLPSGKINPGQMTSFNHYALGAVAHFMHKYIGGLSPLHPGWKRALVKPLVGGTVRSAETSFDSAVGRYAVRWDVLPGEGGEGKMHVEVQVPPNGEARVVLEGVDEVVGGGRYEWEVEWKEDGRWPPRGIRGPQSVAMPDEYVP